MVVRYLYGIGIVSPPVKTNSKLIVDPDTVLSLPVAMHLLQPVSGRDSEILKRLGAIEHRQLSLRNACGRCPASFSGSPDFRRLFVGETLDHRPIITLFVINVNR
jgi:hypothetical protein